MQIIFFIVIVLAAIVFLIYTINKKFGLREFYILIAVLIIPIIGTSFLLNNIAGTVPDLFKEKYEKEKNVQILKLSYERLNNKNISSTTNYVYNFDYIVKKDGKELVCNAKSVKIKKIEDEYVFEDFENIKEECASK